MRGGIVRGRHYSTLPEEGRPVMAIYFLFFNTCAMVFPISAGLATT